VLSVLLLLDIVLSVLIFWPLCCLCFSFGHCVVCTSLLADGVVCTSSIYTFWLPLWYLQTLLTGMIKSLCCYTFMMKKKTGGQQLHQNEQ
jgi:ubiquitin-protein ligase